MKMHSQMAFNWTGEPSVDFLVGMIPHHAAAVTMCDIYYEYWACAPGRKLCKEEEMDKEKIQRYIKDRKYDQIGILNYMHHICTGYILEVQPKEITWMKEELKRIVASNATLN